MPGGRIHDNENLITALKREIREKTGAYVDILREIGVIIEYGRSGESGLHQIAYGYLARVEGDIGESFLTDEEIADGLQLEWVDMDKAIETSESDRPSSDAGKFIRCRELAFLLRANEFIKGV